MEQIRLLIVENSDQYMKILGKTIANFCLDFSVTIVDISKGIVALANSVELWGKEYDFVLLDSKTFIEIQGVIKKIQFNYLIFSENISDDDKLIYKYQPVDIIINQLRLYVGDKKPQIMIYDDSDGMVLGVLSSSGNAGKTTIAICLARLLSQTKEKKVIYINFEEFPTAHVYTDFLKENVPGLREYLYYLYDKKTPQGYIESFLLRDQYEVDYFFTSEGKNPLRDLSENELTIFVASVVNAKKYDYIVIDFASDASAETLALMKWCQKIVFVEEGSLLNKMRNNMWKAFFQHELSRYTEENFVVVNNKSVSFQLKMESEQFPGKSIIQIPYERDSFTHSEGKIDISQVKGFSSGVKKLMEEIVQYGE